MTKQDNGNNYNDKDDYPEMGNVPSPDEEKQVSQVVGNMVRRQPRGHQQRGSRTTVIIWLGCLFLTLLVIGLTLGLRGRVRDDARDVTAAQTLQRCQTFLECRGSDTCACVGRTEQQ